MAKLKKRDKWVPHELNKNHKCKHFEISFALFLCNQNYLFLNQTVTCDEKWILYDNYKCSVQYLDTDKAPQHFPKPKLHQKKVTMTVWWSSAFLIDHSFIKLGETITAEKSCREIDEMHQKLARKKPTLVNRKGPIFLHDNARLHI